MSIFPIMTTTSQDDWSGDAPCRFHPEGGLTKRELFAAMAMQHFLTSHLSTMFTMGKSNIFESSVAIADALIAELAK